MKDGRVAENSCECRLCFDSQTSVFGLHVCNDDSTSRRFHGSCSAGNICCVLCLCQFLVLCETAFSFVAGILRAEH